MIQTFPLRTSYPLAIREKLSRLMKMAFPTICQPGQGVYDLNQVLDFEMSRALGVSHWWLAPVGGTDTVTASKCDWAYTYKGAASLVASYDNNAAPLNGLADGTYDNTLGVAPSWDTLIGSTFNGSTQWLKTSWTPANTNISIIVRISACSEVNDPENLVGAYDSVTPTGICLIRNRIKRAYCNGQTVLEKVGSITSGTIGFAGGTAYLNGLSDGAITVGIQTVVPLYVAALNFKNTSAIQKSSATYICLSAYNDVLTPTEFLALHNAAMAI